MKPTSIKVVSNKVDEIVNLNEYSAGKKSSLTQSSNVLKYKRVKRNGPAQSFLCKTFKKAS